MYTLTFLALLGLLEQSASATFTMLSTGTTSLSTTTTTTSSPNLVYKPPVAPPPKKVAIIMADWGDPYFKPEALKMNDQLKRAGWMTFVLDGSTPVTGDTMYAVLNNILTANLNSGDDVLLDIQGHGSEGQKTFNLYDYATGAVTGTFKSTYENGFYYYGYEKTLAYPYYDVEMQADHYVTTYIPGTKLYSITARELGQIASRARDLGGKVTIIDHSCNGGSTSRYIEQQSYGANICTIATAGLITPGLTGYPWVSSYLYGLNNSGTIHSYTMNDVAKFISDTYATNQHVYGERLQSIGYRASCNETMPIRDTLYNMSNMWSTTWDWDRSMPSHVFREPKRYTNSADLSPNPVNWGYDDQQFPRGWARWHLEAISNFYRAHAFTTYVSGLYSVAYTTTVPPQVNKIYNDGLAVNAAVQNQKAALDKMNTDAQFKTNFFGSSVATAADEYLRTTLESVCLCPTKSTSPVNAWASKLNCQPFVALPPAYATTPSAICTDTAAYVAQVVALSPGGALAADKTAFDSASSALKTATITMSNDLRTYESTCSSTACQARAL